MNETTQAQVNRKLDTAYMIANCRLREKITAVCALEEHYGTDLGGGYKHDCGHSVFIKCIAHDQRERLVADPTRSKFFSIQANMGVLTQLFLVLYVDYYSKREKVRIVNCSVWDNLKVEQVKLGLFDCLKSAFEYIEVTGWETKLDIFDGTNANIGEHDELNEHLK